MNHARKMVLVPEQTLERLERRQNVSTPPLTARLNGLDHEITDVLKDKKLSEDEKVLQYSQALQNYLHYYNERKNQPINVKVQQPIVTPKAPENAPQEPQEQPQQQEVTQEPRAEVNKNIEREIIQALPKTLKDRGRRLLEKIKENSDVMKWDDKGRLVVDGTAQQGTHISDLIKDSLRASKKNSPGPMGWEMFTQGLARMNAPESLIRNAQRKLALRSFKSAGQEPPQEAEWFPTPSPFSPRPAKSRKRTARGETTQRWLTFRP